MCIIGVTGEQVLTRSPIEVPPNYGGLSECISLPMSKHSATVYFVSLVSKELRRPD